MKHQPGSGEPDVGLQRNSSCFGAATQNAQLQSSSPILGSDEIASGNGTIHRTGHDAAHFTALRVYARQYWAVILGITRAAPSTVDAADQSRRDAFKIAYVKQNCAQILAQNTKPNKKT